MAESVFPKNVEFRTSLALQRDLIILSTKTKDNSMQVFQGLISCKNVAKRNSFCPTFSDLFLAINLGNCKTEFLM
jgi:hypothetical protein